MLFWAFYQSQARYVCELCYCSVLVSAHRFKNEWSYMCSMLVSTHGFQKELCYMCVVCLFRLTVLRKQCSPLWSQGNLGRCYDLGWRNQRSKEPREEFITWVFWCAFGKTKLNECSYTQNRHWRVITHPKCTLIEYLKDSKRRSTKRLRKC